MARKKTKLWLCRPTASRAVTRHQTAARKAVFPFLKLPPELRKEIYKLVLRTDIPVNINSSCAVKHITAMEEVGHGWITRQIEQKCVKKLGVLPAIILLNKQTHEEAIVVLYSTAQFVVANDLMEPALSIESFIDSTKTANFALIRNVSLRLTVCCDAHTENWSRILHTLFGYRTNWPTLDLLQILVTDTRNNVLSPTAINLGYLSFVASTVRTAVTLSHAQRTVLVAGESTWELQQGRHSIDSMLDDFIPVKKEANKAEAREQMLESSVL